MRSTLIALAKFPLFESVIFRVAAAIGRLISTSSRSSKGGERNVDAVYLWVDDQDPHWQDKRRRYMRSDVSPDATSPSRFRQFDELYFSIRLLAKNAPFIRRVFVVVDNQNPNLEKLSKQVPFEIVLIDHIEIMPPQVLPTFNSRAITANIHRIRGLSERFLYCNDDVFIGRQSVVEDWFDGDKLVPRFTQTRFAELESLDEDESLYRARWKTKGLADASGWPTSASMPEHAPYPLTKSIMKSLWETFPQVLQSTSSSRFRSSNDILPELLAYYYAIGKGQTSQPTLVRYKYIPMTQISAIAPLLDLALNPNRFLTICLNDVSEAPKDQQLSEDVLDRRYRRTLRFLDRA